MLYSVFWAVLLVLLAIWSTGVWVLHALLAWSISGAGVLTGQAQRLENLVVPGWLSAWLPPEWLLTFKTAWSSLLPWFESALAMLPSAASWLSPLAWAVWAIGLLVFASVAAVGHALIWATHRTARA
ncbi:MAG: hypothetical protein IPN53_24880 [Comamonadaceae bacterium]|nr:hypothetical protein [Comamonadaceae bacterium]